MHNAQCVIELKLFEIQVIHCLFFFLPCLVCGVTASW